MTNHIPRQSRQSRQSRQQFEIEELLGALPKDAAFSSTSGQAFISIPVGSGVHTFPLASADVSDWLTNRYRQDHGQLPNENSLRWAIKSLRNQAHYRSRPRPVDVRIVSCRSKDDATNAVFIDLANAEGEAVQVTPTGWQITHPVGVAFRSRGGQLPLPRPAKQPNANEQPAMTNAFLESEVIKEWLACALQPIGPYPVLVLHGPPGSGKTTAARILRALIDPVTAPIQPLPSRGREVLELAVRDRVLAFDHVTRMSNSAADALCQISSGTAVGINEPGGRNREPFRLDIARPVILTTPRCGVSDWQPRSDLAARIIAFEMPKIENARSTQDVWADFEAACPSILAALYTTLSQSLMRSNAERAKSNDEGAALYAASAQADPVFQSILTFASVHGEWTGTAAGLNLPILNPLPPRVLSHRLRQLQPTLASHGIDIEFRRKHNGIREITIRCTSNENLRHPPSEGLLAHVPDSPPRGSPLESSDTHTLGGNTCLNAAILCAFLFCACASIATAADLRLGIVGTDTSHVTAFAKTLNDPSAPDHVPGARVVAAYKGGSPDIESSRSRIDNFTTELRDKWGVKIVDAIPDLCGQVDGILIESVDGRTHLEQARQAVTCHKPIFIDKPLAATLDDARAIAKLSADAGVPWFSSSSLRFGEVQKLRGGNLEGATTWGPGPLEEHHQLDLSWYAIHPIEMLYTIMGTGCEEVTRTSTPDADVVAGRWKDGRIGTVRALRPYSTYGAVAFKKPEGKSRNVTAQVVDATHVGYGELVQEIVKFMETRQPPVANSETLEIFAFMDAAQRSKEAGGKPMKLR